MKYVCILFAALTLAGCMPGTRMITSAYDIRADACVETRTIRHYMPGGWLYRIDTEVHEHLGALCPTDGAVIDHYRRSFLKND
ncbi:MAG: hypothetical protein PHX68_02855 [Alphaproteobacteria bacterium]|nr:hypothetical protein [Alphaproteobacteria bacterium]